MSPARRINNRKLLTKAQHNELGGRAYAYARGLLADPETTTIGAPPFSLIDGKTIAQRAWRDGYIAALRDIRKGKVTL